MTDLPELAPPWSRIPLVHDDTALFPEPTLGAMTTEITQRVVASPELNATIGDLAPPAVAEAVTDADVPSLAASAVGIAVTAADIPGTVASEADAKVADEVASQVAPEVAAAQTARTGAQDARAGAESARAGAEAARDLALAGQFLGAPSSSLTGVDLNTVMTPGVYRANSVSNATLERNYPRVGALGVLTVTTTTSTTSGTIQRFVMLGGFSGASAGTTVRGEFIRSFYSGAWTPWRFIPSQRVDQTAGRAIYTWDDLNNREQLIYGDTGWRDLSALLINGWKASSFALRRVMHSVEIRATGFSAADATSGIAMQTPPGFSGWNSVSDAAITAFVSSSKVWRVTPASNFLIAGYSATDPDVAFSATYSLTSAWPSVLPGTALAGIPS